MKNFGQKFAGARVLITGGLGFIGSNLARELVALGARYLATGAVADVLAAVGYVFIAIWAYLELTAGVNMFRRALGLAGLAYIVVIIAQRFGA